MTMTQKQCLLRYCGFYAGDIDGIWGEQSQRATIDFQRSYMDTVDGIFGDATEKRILAVVASGEPPQKSSGWWKDIRYFQRSEFRCPCGKCGGFPAEPSETLVRLADKVRGKAGRPMVPTSTVRCKAHNKAVGGKDTSRHMKGKAMDFVIPGMTSAEILAIVRSFPEVVFCYAINERAVHMDVGN